MATSKDPEIKAILAVQRAVAPLTPEERRRVLDYVFQRSVNAPGQEAAVTFTARQAAQAQIPFPHSHISYASNSGQA